MPDGTVSPHTTSLNVRRTKHGVSVLDLDLDSELATSPKGTDKRWVIGNSSTRTFRAELNRLPGILEAESTVDRLKTVS